jgi:hypothetical protein
MRGLFEQSALARTALDALKLQHQQQRHHQVIDVAAIGSCRKLEDQREQAAGKEAAARRATDAQVLEDAERLIAAARAKCANQNCSRHHRPGGGGGGRGGRGGGGLGFGR